MKKIKIGQIGIGHNHGADKMIALRGLTDYFDVVGVVESDPVWLEKRKNLKAYENLPWMTEEELFSIPDLDAVAVETDGFDLVPTALRCAERGLHIHLDKPGGESLSEFRKLLDCCTAKKRAIQLAYVYRYNPGVRFMMDAVKSGALGDLFEIHAVMSRYDGDNEDYRRWLAQFKGGSMYIFAGYLIDLVIAMLGVPDQVTAYQRKTRGDSLYDNGLAVMEYPIATATIRVSVAEIDGMKHRRLIFCGTKGSVELCPIEAPASRYAQDPLLVRLTLKEPWRNYAPGTHTVDCGMLGCRYSRQLIEFAEIVRDGMENPYSAEHEYQVHRALLAASGYGSFHSL